MSKPSKSAAFLPLAALLVSGCVQTAPVAVSGTRIYAIDLAGGARKCTAPADVQLAQGHETPVVMSVSNEGGWCAFKVDQSDAKLGTARPFTAGLVTTRAAHGRVYVHTVGDDTRIDYTPDARYAGSDAFTVELLPGGLSVHTDVTVTPG